MPESLYKEFSPEQLRDLFSFLQAKPPKIERDNHESGMLEDSFVLSPW